MHDHDPRGTDLRADDLVIGRAAEKPGARAAASAHYTGTTPVPRRSGYRRGAGSHPTGHSAQGPAYPDMFGGLLGDDPASRAFATSTTSDGEPVPYKPQMERLFGENFGRVKAHAGQTALSAANLRGAARGETVAFASSSPDKALVAHELTHVVQQRRTGTTAVAAKASVSQPSDPAEREADAVADRVRTRGLTGSQVQVCARPTAGIHLERGNDAGNMSVPAATPKLSIVPRDMDLGSVRVGQQRTFWATLLNDSDRPVAFNRLGDAVLGQLPAPLRQLDGSPGLIGPGDQMGIQLAFNPTKRGRFSETLCAFDHDGAVLGQMNIHAQVKQPGRLAATSKRVDFHLAIVNQPTMSSSHALTVTNVGDEPLKLGSVSSQGADADQFHVADLAPTTLAPGHEAAVEVEFAPTSRGQKQAVIRFEGTPIADGQPGRVLATALVKGHAVVDTSRKGQGDSAAELATSLSQQESTAKTPGQRQAELRRLAETNACKNNKSAQCFLSDRGRLRLMQMLYQRIGNAAGQFASAVTEEKLVHILKPADNSALLMAVETFYVLAGIGSGKLAQATLAAMQATGPETSARGWAGIGSVATQAKHLRDAPAVLQFAFSTATRSARAYAKVRIKSQLGDSSLRQAFFDNVNDEMRAQAQLIGDNLGSLNDTQLLALTAYYDAQNHPSSRYRKGLRQLVATYQRDVEGAGRGNRVAMRIVGPGGQARMAMCVTIGMRGMPHQERRHYKFGWWIERGFEAMAARAQVAAYDRRSREYRKAGGATVSAVTPEHVGSHALRELRHDDERLFDPNGEVARWVAQSTCVHVPNWLDSDVPAGKLCGGDRFSAEGDEHK